MFCATTESVIKSFVVKSKGGAKVQKGGQSYNHGQRYVTHSLVTTT